MSRYCTFRRWMRLSPLGHAGKEKKIIWIAGRRFVLGENRTRCPYNRPVLALSLSITEESINIGFVAIKICWKICILP